MVKSPLERNGFDRQRAEAEAMPLATGEGIVKVLLEDVWAFYL